MKPVCFSIIVPDGYTHSFAFKEIVELMMYVMQEHGIPCVLRNNDILPTHINIIFGAHMLDPFFTYQLPPDTIVFNTEQLTKEDNKMVDTVCSFAEAGLHVWDYSDANLTFLAQKVGPGSLSRIVLGYHRLLDRIPVVDDPEIDLLFYGSINSRREKVLNELEGSGLNVCRLFDVYGESRDECIANSKAVLNFHYFESKIFEIVRVFYLLCNGKTVIAEIGEDTVVDPDVVGSLVPSSYDNLIETAVDLIQSGSWRSPNESGREVMRQRDVWGSIEAGLTKVLGQP